MIKKYIIMTKIVGGNFINMEKIVTEPIKIDLHIHSAASRKKDPSTVKDSTKENLSTLIAQLKGKEINMVAITDHDAFDYSLYEELKKEETKDNCIKKVLPGIEFTVSFERFKKEKVKNKPVHVIAIFDDKDNEKVKTIEKIIGEYSYDNDEKKAFKEITLIEILSKIGLNTVLIAHQKNTMERNGERCEAIGKDISNVGDEGVDELIAIEYFEAFEFKNMKNEVFNNQVKQKYPNGELRFITGSDCHEWKAYPKHDSKSNDSDFKPTILKCLPTFKGLAFAITENSRMSFENNFFTAYPNNYISNIQLELENQLIDIPLSRGINVIIGDNSIGKSLLLHKLTKYYKVDDPDGALTKKLIREYDKYLETIHLSVLTGIEKDKILRFDSQGEIRKMFLHNRVDVNSFFGRFFPDDPHTEIVRRKISENLDRLINYLKNRREYYNEKNKIKDIIICSDEVNRENISLEKEDLSNLESQKKKMDKIIEQIGFVLAEIKKLRTLIEDDEKIKEIEDYFIKQKEEYSLKSQRIKKSLDLFDCIHSAFDEFDNNLKQVRSSVDSKLHSFNNAKKDLCQQIFQTLKCKIKIKKMPDIDLDEKIEMKSRTSFGYYFVKRTKEDEFNVEYFKSCCKSIMKKGFVYESLRDMSFDEFVDMLKAYSTEKGDPYEYFKMEVLKNVGNDLKIISLISKDKNNSSKEESVGENAHIYFDIYSNDNIETGIYLIDQPEDDISPKSIKEYLLDDFGLMRKDRQIIMVTHNPQFVVNLDADNVICMQRDKDGKKILIRSGALEYEDSEYNIIQLVAELLDGGVELIKKRWKRYEKDNSF